MKEKDYIEIIKNDLHYDKTFCFRELEVYKNPVHGKETENISQAKIIGAIINEVERAERGENVNDIFVTAMTGFGKSIIYQTAAVCIAKKYQNLLREIREYILDDIDFIMECIEECPEYFSISEFRNKFSLSYGAVQASIISENIFSIGDPTGKTIDIMFNEEKNQNMYKINISEFGEKLRNIINSSDIVDLLTNVEKEEFELFTAFLGGKRKAALRLLSIFGYISFRTNGVEDPEIVININDSEKLQEVIADDDYKNSFIEKSDLRHKKEIMLQKEFFENDMSDSMRWEYIENYFLGKM